MMICNRSINILVYTFSCTFPDLPVLLVDIVAALLWTPIPDSAYNIDILLIGIMTAILVIAIVVGMFITEIVAQPLMLLLLELVSTVVP